MVRVFDVSVSTMIGELAGLNLKYCGLLRSEVGRSARAACIAACTSLAAPLMSREKSNCTTMRTEPCVLCEVISVTPAIWPRWRSSGAATEVATSSGEPPGCCASTMMVGKSTCGSGATGSLV